MSRPKYRRPGSRRSQELVPSLRDVVQEHQSDPLVVLESVRDDGRGLMLRTWDLHGPRMEELLARGLEYELSFATARRPDGLVAQSRLFKVTQPLPVTVHTATFGPIVLPRSGAVLVDGGTGRVGHRLDLDISGRATWERRNGCCEGCAGEGAIGVHGRDWTDYLRLSDAAWTHMKAPAPAARGSEMPDWLWVVALRLGDEVRVRESLPGTTKPPADIARLLEWMARCVEAWCIASEEREPAPAPELEAVRPYVAPETTPPAHLGGGIGDAVARVRNEGWGPIIPPLKRGRD